MGKVHNVFHISVLRLYKPDESHIIDWKGIEVQDGATYEEAPLRILDTKEQVLRTKTTRFVKFLWKYRMVPKKRPGSSSRK